MMMPPWIFGVLQPMFKQPPRSFYEGFTMCHPFTVAPISKAQVDAGDEVVHIDDRLAGMGGPTGEQQMAMGLLPSGNLT